ncbi:MAG: hypothetical protein ACREQQ_05125 [Candidatus Binatia bacterium]
MAKAFVRGTLLIPAMLIFLAPVTPAESLSPEETLRRYLTAVQQNQFDKAYDVVSKAMKTDRRTGQIKPKEVYVKESQYIMAFSEAKIFDFKIHPAKVEGDKAMVPNILSSQDKFLNQLGVEEYELYTLLKEDGAWKVDQQQEVIEKKEIAEWFKKTPAEKPAKP